MFEGDQVAGPVPTLFAEEPESSMTAIKANPAKAFTDLQRMVRCFMMPETISEEEADSFVKKPR